MKVHHVRKARKNNVRHGIKKGESYYWWQFYRCEKSYSKTFPRASQLTRSDFMGQFLAIGEGLEDLGIDDVEALQSAVETAIEDLRSLGSEQEDKISNMPESLQQSDTAWLLQERADKCEELAGELESIDFDCSDDGADIDGILDEIKSVDFCCD